MISHFDRIQASEGWHDAALMIKKELERIGYKDIVLEGWPSNGSSYYYNYRTPIGWRAKRAELWMVSPRRERLCSYEALNFVDGERSVFDITRAVSAEFGPVNIKDIKNFFKIIEKAELIRLKNI